jgi:hypothetical protein
MGRTSAKVLIQKIACGKALKKLDTPRTATVSLSRLGFVVPCNFGHPKMGKEQLRLSGV